MHRLVRSHPWRASCRLIVHFILSGHQTQGNMGGEDDIVFQSATRDVLISTAKLIGEISYFRQNALTSRPLTLRKAMAPKTQENVVEFLQRTPVVILLQEVTAKRNGMNLWGPVLVD